MAKALIIAEKPSVANDIARVLGNFNKNKDYFESNKYVISSAIGHLLEIKEPEEYEVKRGKWSFNRLPIIPPYFDLRPIKKSESRLKILSQLIERKDINLLVNACDAGREGELIFHYIIQYTHTKKPVKRLWLQSMTPKAIQDGFANLRGNEDMLSLADAARCRSEADWLVGINGTRALTAFNNRNGGFFLTKVGRVQTPTLSIVVKREEKIRNFLPRKYWEVKAEFSCQEGFYEGVWFSPNFKRSTQEDPEQRENRIWNESEAHSIAKACRRSCIGKIIEESKPSFQMSPALFDLTSLQREANNRFGFSAKSTLCLAQSLYEKHKVLTYPRTDSRALPEDQIETAKDVIYMLQGNENYSRFSREILEKNWAQKNQRIFDDKRVTDHFAIIPTLQKPKNLSILECKLYDLVVRRFLAVFYPALEFQVTTRITEVSGYNFKSEGKVLIYPGWLQIYGNNNQDDQKLTPIHKDEIIKINRIATEELITRPPVRYSEATLLSAMEYAGKSLDNEELREAMASKGLGTPATRASIIEGLLSEKYLLREGRKLIPTAKSFQLITLLSGLGIQELTHAELTGEWEHKLKKIEHGDLQRKVFMKQIENLTKNIVHRAKEYNADTIPGNYIVLVSPCPKCGNQVKENYQRFVCINCKFSINKIIGGRQFEIQEVEKLLRDKEIGPLSGFRSKIGRPFSSTLKLGYDKDLENYRLEFDFGQKQSTVEWTIDFPKLNSLGRCPKCFGHVFEHGMDYICENYNSIPRICDFYSSRMILQKEIDREQIKKLLIDGKTDLLSGFRSSKSGRSFKAYLIKQKDGKIGFEFEK